MSSVGVKIDQFDIPVCNSFQAKIFNDQLCYELDLNNFTKKQNIKEELKSGFNFIMDYNEDRQVLVDRKLNGKKNIALASSIVESDHHTNAFVYLDTIGKNMFSVTFPGKACVIIEPVTLIGEGEYNINALTEIKVTDSYLDLDDDVRDCQSKESLYDCRNRKYVDTILDQCGCLPLNMIVASNTVNSTSN